MGITKQKNGDNHIVFHVGKELPQQGDNFLIGIGRQNAQGRGIYCSEQPELSYEGSEHYRKQLPITPIFCIPMAGTWKKGKLKMKNNKVVMHTDGRLIAMRDLHFKDITDPNGKTLRFYFSTDISFIPEPKTQIFDEFSNALRSGKMSSDEGLSKLEGHYQITGERVDPRIIVYELFKAIDEGKIPKIEELERIKDLSNSMRSDLITTIQNPELRHIKDSNSSLRDNLK